MAIPDIPELREFLIGIRLSRHKPSAPGAGMQLPFLPAVDEAGRLSREPPLWLHYPSGTKVTFQSALERINRELNASRHARHDEFALFVLAIAALMPSAHGGVVSRINRIIAHVCDTNVSLYYILFAGFPEDHNFEIPPFRLGPLRAEKLRYSCEKVESDFYVRYRDILPKAWAVERDPQKIRVFDIPPIREAVFDGPLGKTARQSWEFQAWESIVNGYFSLHNRVLFDHFWVELIAAQSPLLAIGAPYFDPRPLSNVIQNTRVAVFQNLGRDKKGFVAPSGTGPLLIDFANVHQRVPRLLKELKSSYNFDRFDDTPLHRTMKLFADFVARARRHEIDGRQSEALLHFVIALELVFGDRQAIQKNVAERVAVITFRENRRSFQEQRDWIDAIYDLRSKYVHAGTEIRDESHLDQLRGLCEQVFRCLLRLQEAHRERSSRGEEVLAGWRRELDYIAAGLTAGRPPSEAQLSEAFIL